VEVRPRDDARMELIFSVHAADLASARDLGADPAGTDFEWLRGRSESEGKAFLSEAHALLINTFSLAADGADVDLGLLLRFPVPAVLVADPASIETVRPGFLEATLVLPAGIRRLTVSHAPLSGKRLLLVRNRPGAFPLVSDLAPGESVNLTFQSDPP